MRQRQSGRDGVAKATTCMRLPATGLAGATWSAARARWLSRLDLELATVELVAVETLDRLVGLLGRRHLDETESPRLGGIPVRDDGRRFHGTRFGKKRPETFRGRGKR